MRAIVVGFAFVLIATDTSEHGFGAASVLRAFTFHPYFRVKPAKSQSQQDTVRRSTLRTSYTLALLFCLMPE
jgi:hypothetical protein